MNTQSRRVALLTTVMVALGCQPHDETPGLWLRGEIVEERVEDWRFTREIDEIFVETRPWYGIPHSTTIWCVELGGELYVGSYGDEKKTWEKNIASDARAQLAIAAKLYRVTLTPVTTRLRSQALDAAYAQKYDLAEVFGDALPSWRYYHVSPDW